MEEERGLEPHTADRAYCFRGSLGSQPISLPACGAAPPRRALRDEPPPPVRRLARRASPSANAACAALCTPREIRLAVRALRCSPSASGREEGRGLAPHTVVPCESRSK